MGNTIRFSILPLAVLAGCATAPTVVPAGGAPQASATAGPVTLTVFPSAWDGDPDDLTDYVTPVAVELYNAGPEPVRVSYFDFALTDDKGFRYAALNPFVTAQADARDDLPMNQLVAWRGGGGGGGFHGGGGGFHVGGGGGHFYGGGSSTTKRGTYVPPPAVHGGFGGGYRGPVGGGYRGPVGGGYHAYHGWGGAHYGGYPRPMVRSGVYLGPPAWRGYSVLPYYRPWFGVGVGFGYWGDPFFWPPGYSTWVWAWSPAYYPSSSPPTDVITYGLPEGVLQPGGRVSGFLYFQRSNPGAERLQLEWNAADAKSGGTVAAARVDLELRR